MKKLLLLLCTLLAGASGAWAAEVVVMFSSSSIQSTNSSKGGGQGQAQFYDTDSNPQSDMNWYPKCVTDTDIPVTLDFGTETRLSNWSGYVNANGSVTMTISVPTGYTLKSYSFKTKVTNEAGGTCTITPTGGSGVSMTYGDDLKTVTASNLSSSSTTIGFAGTPTSGTESIVSLEEFSLTVETGEDTDVSWNSGYTDTSDLDMVGATWIGITTPGTSADAYTLTSLDLYMYVSGGSGTYDAKSTYMGIFTSANPCGETWVAFSDNKPVKVTSNGYVNFKFSSGVQLVGGQTYYIYFFDSTDSYTATFNRIGLVKSATYTPGIYWSNSAKTTYAPLFNATLSKADVKSWSLLNESSGSSGMGSFTNIKVVMPSTSDVYTLSSFDLYLYATSATADNKDNYMLISERNTTSNDLKKNEVLGASSNAPATLGNGIASRYRFDTPVYLKGGKTYYLYFTKELVEDYTDTYTLKDQRIYLTNQGGSSNVDENSVLNTGYEPKYSAVLDILDSSPAITDSEGDELVDDGTYRIALPGRSGIVVMTQNSSNFNPQTWTASENQIWRVKKDGSTYKFTAAVDGDSKYWAVSSYSEGNTKVTASSTVDDATSWTISKVSTLNNTYNITSTNESTTYYLSNHGGGSKNMGFYNSNTGFDGGSLFLFTPVEEQSYRCETVAGSIIKAQTTGFVSATAESAPIITGYTYQSVSTVDDVVVFKYLLTSNPIVASTISEPNWCTMTQTVSNSANYFRYSGDKAYINTTSISNYLDNHLWIFIGDANNGYDIYNKASGKYLVKSSGTDNTTINNTTEYFLTMSSSASTKWEMLYGGYLNDITDGKKVNRSENRPMLWSTSSGVTTITEVPTITMLNPEAVDAEVGQADVYMSYANSSANNMLLSSDAMVYKVQAGGTEDAVDLVSVTSLIVPASGAVVLGAKNGISIPYVTTTASESLDDNVLQAGDGSSAVSGYLLAYKKDGDGTPKFYLMDSLVLAANKAYLPANYFDSEIKVLNLNFDDDDATAVHTVERDGMGETTIFSLSGQRLVKPIRGLNIVNGRKVVVK